MNPSSHNCKALLNSACTVFWDFDGVIKDSMDVKACAFERLFLPYGIELARTVRRHHEANGGVSRFDKIPLYLSWAGEPPDSQKIEAFCRQFSHSVVRAVINAPWVPGVHQYLLENFSRQYFVLITATPQKEIEQILAALELPHCFREVHGAPATKSDVVKTVLSRLNYSPETALVIGDSETDLWAAQANNVAFLLRRTPLNRRLQARYSGPVFDNLNHE